MHFLAFRKTGISRIALFWLEKCYPEQKTRGHSDMTFPEIHLRGILACRGRLFSLNLLFGFPAFSLFAENPQPEHHLGGKSQSTAATVFPGIRILIFGGKALVVRGFSPETGIGVPML